MQVIGSIVGAAGVAVLVFGGWAAGTAALLAAGLDGCGQPIALFAPIVLILLASSRW
jgi:hypothetical protein